MDAKQRLKALKKIKRNAQLKRSGAIPWMPLAMLGGITGGAIGFLIGELAIPGHSGLALFAGGVAGALLGYRKSKYIDWATCIYDQLIEYQPLDQEDYHDLQKLAAENKLTSDDVIYFAGRELDRIEPRMSDSSSSELARQRFAANK